MLHMYRICHFFAAFRLYPVWKCQCLLDYWIRIYGNLIYNSGAKSFLFLCVPFFHYFFYVQLSLLSPILAMGGKWLNLWLCIMNHLRATQKCICIHTLKHVFEFRNWEFRFGIWSLGLYFFISLSSWRVHIYQYWFKARNGSQVSPQFIIPPRIIWKECVFEIWSCL